mgnify:CR=1 FL=1
MVKDTLSIHYMSDGNPLPSFEGEPKLISIPDSIEEFSQLLWNNLNSDNKFRYLSDL